VAPLAFSSAKSLKLESFKADITPVSLQRRQLFLSDFQEKNALLFYG
jgi:hypothetical protein